MKIFNRRIPLDAELECELDNAVDEFATVIAMPITEYASAAAARLLEYADAEITECDRILAEATERRERAVRVRDAFRDVPDRLDAAPSTKDARKRSKPALVEVA